MEGRYFSASESTLRVSRLGEMTKSIVDRRWWMVEGEGQSVDGTRWKKNGAGRWLIG